MAEFSAYDRQHDFETSTDGSCLFSGNGTSPPDAPRCGRSHPKRTGEIRLKVWSLATAPLFLHFLSVAILTFIVLKYVDGGKFNLYSRRPSYTQLDGSKALVNRFTPLQSDITTAISSGITILKVFSISWSTATAWRCVFILMKTNGISLEQIDTLLHWKILVPSSSRRPNPAPAGIAFLITICLFIAIPCQLSGPILTGSITWSQSFTHTQSQQPITSIAHSGGSGGGWYWYNYYGGFGRTWEIPNGAGYADIAWPNATERATMKRVIRGTEQLAKNSLLDNVTLPYFAVGSIEWVRDPITELSQKQVQSVNDPSSSNPFRGQLPNTFALVPDSSWDPLPADRTTFPSPVKVSETRLLVGMHGRGNTNISCGVNGPFGTIPENIGFYVKPSGSDTNCYIYARVSYEAGVADCRPCRLSSRLTVQNDTVLTILPDPMTVDALALMPMLAVQMVNMNASLPKAYNNLDQYVTELLIRSYGAAWTAVTESAGDDVGVATGVQIAVPVSQANILKWRVFLWFLLNMMFTVSGLLFIVVQQVCKQPLIGNAPLAALLLDTTAVLHEGDRSFCNFSMLVDDDKGIGHLKLRQTHELEHRSVVIVY